MNAFDFLHDAPPDWVDALRSIRIPGALIAPLAAVTAAVVVVCLWAAIGECRLNGARAELAFAQGRYERSRIELQAAKLARIRVVALIGLDARVQELRYSGMQQSRTFAEIAAHVPQPTWLTSIAASNAGFDLTGNTQGLGGLSHTLTDLIAAPSFRDPTLVRASRRDATTRRDILRFTIHLPESTR